MEAEHVAAQNGNGKVASNGNGASEIKVIIDPSMAAAAVATTNGNGSGNGNGKSSNGVSSNGNGIANGNGKASSTTAAVASTSAGTATAAAAVASEAERMRMMNTIDEEQNAEAAGQLELAAATARERKARSAAGTPYKAPGGSWSKFKTYSVWQVSNDNQLRCTLLFLRYTLQDSPLVVCRCYPAMPVHRPLWPPVVSVQTTLRVLAVFLHVSAVFCVILHALQTCSVLGSILRSTLHVLRSTPGQLLNWTSG